MKHEPRPIKRHRAGWTPAGEAEPEHAAVSKERRQRRAERREKARLLRLANPSRKGRDSKGRAK